MPSAAFDYDSIVPQLWTELLLAVDWFECAAVEEEINGLNSTKNPSAETHVRLSVSFPKSALAWNETRRIDELRNIKTIFE